MQTFIYSLIDPRDNCPKYIGATTQKLSYRLKQHLIDNDGKKRFEWILELKNVGLIPNIEMVDVVPNKESDFWEQHYISLYRSWGFDLTNMTYGGIKKYSKSIKQEVSLETREKMRIRRIGTKLSEEIKQKQSKTRIEKKLGTKKVVQYSLGGMFIKEWDSITEAAKQLNICRVHISGVCKGHYGQKTCGGFIWKYKEVNNG